MPQSNQLMHFPVRVRAVGDAERKAKLLSILREQRALDADVLEQHAPFFWGATISNNRLDSYFTLMLPSSLQNYAAEAAAGVAFLPGHDHQHLPIGGSLTGELLEAGDVTEVRADFYTLAGLQIGSVDTDGFIVSVKAGLTRDVSIGFHGGKWICQICEQDYFRSSCPHLAGYTYEDETDGVIRQQLCTVGIDGAHLAEVSGVFDGATPGAMIDKVHEMASQGALSVDDVRHAEHIYRLDRETAQRMLQLPALQKRHAGVDTRAQPRREDVEMTDEELKRVQAVLTRAGVKTADESNAEEWVTSIVAGVETLAAKLDAATARAAELEPRAADGDQYRNDLVAAALAEGVRAYGEKFDSETYRATLEHAPLATIQRMRDDWQSIGDGRFAGGRQTDDGDEPAQEGQVHELHAPASMYV